MKRLPWSKLLVGVGLGAMLLGAMDPLEGSVVIVAGSALAATGAAVGRGRRRRLLLAAFLSTLVGVSLLFAWSSVGGFGGDTGYSMWWALTLMPYPIGWLASLVGAFRTLRDRPVTDPTGSAP